MEPRNYESGAVGTAPTAPASPSNGYATDGNPSLGTPATRPGAHWYHKIGEELRAIIVAAGLTPSDSNIHQVLDAIQALFIGLSNFTGGNQSLGSGGYQKLPGGLILQWGSVAITSGSNVAVTFPIAFPTACFKFNANFVSAGTMTGGYTAGGRTPTTTGVTVDAFSNAGGSSTYNWLAIGK